MIQNFKEQLANAKHIAVVAHQRPDADSLGSASALYTYILQLHKKVSFVCATKEISKKFSVIPWSDKLKTDIPQDVDVVIVCDVASKERIGLDLEDHFVVNIDHHRSNTMFGDINFVASEAISTTVIVFEILQNLGAKINKKIATALYAGLWDDSDGFSAPNVCGMVFAFAQRLIDYGADHKKVVQYLQKYSTLSELRLFGAMLLEMRLLFDAQWAWFCVTQEMLERYGAEVESCEAALEKSLELPTVHYGVLLVEKPEGGVKVSFRSIEGDVLQIAKYFGGGGHTLRAGCDFEKDSSLESVEKIILEKVREIEKKK